MIPKHFSDSGIQQKTVVIETSKIPSKGGTETTLSLKQPII
jgi:hypothetical protein